MKPDVLAFNQHVSDPLFQIGVEHGKWGILNNSDERPEWPFILIWIAAAEHPNSPNKYYFKFELDGYPANAPNICIWDVEKDVSLSAQDRPKGTGNVAIIFRTDWHGNQHLYVPYERFALQTHPDWPNQYPNLQWKPTDKIYKIVNDLHNHLTSTEYNGK